MPPRLVDTHAHAQFHAFAGETDEVIRRALAAGTWVNLVGTQTATSRIAVETAARLGDGVFATVGLHPSHLLRTHEDDDELGAQMPEERFDPTFYATLAAHPRVVAVGECGLDFYHLSESVSFFEVRALQREQFAAQLDFADAQDLPIVVHCRDGRTPETAVAHQDVLALLAERFAAGKNPRRGVMHCYTGDWPTAERYLALGMYISFSGIVTFPPRKTGREGTEALQEALRRVPVDRLLLETDAPYLAPLPHRGERNEPAYVEHVARYAASVRGTTFEGIAAETSGNALAVFPKIKQS